MSKLGRKAIHGHTKLVHGKVKTSTTYNSWRKMIERCYNKNSNRYKYYGARGISVCDNWRTFKNFLADMGCKPGFKYSIDRIDNNGNYEPGNCRWATPIQQRHNRRD